MKTIIVILGLISTSSTLLAAGITGDAFKNALTRISEIRSSHVVSTRDSVTVCNRDNTAPEMTFTVDGNSAALTYSTDDIEPQSFIVTKTIKSDKGDPELIRAIGEISDSYTQYSVSSPDGDDFIIIAVGKSGAKYLVIVGPMGKLFMLGSTSACKQAL